MLFPRLILNSEVLIVEKSFIWRDVVTIEYKSMPLIDASFLCTVFSKHFLSLAKNFAIFLFYIERCDYTISYLI